MPIHREIKKILFFGSPEKGQKMHISVIKSHILKVETTTVQFEPDLTRETVTDGVWLNQVSSVESLSTKQLNGLMA